LSRPAWPVERQRGGASFYSEARAEETAALTDTAQTESAAVTAASLRPISGPPVSESAAWLLPDLSWPEASREVTERLIAGPTTPPARWGAAETAEALTLQGGVFRLLVMDTVDLEPRPFQLAVVRKVLGEMRGRAILADEVGLGKTIECLLIVREYMLRGEVRRALILTPASLVEQWLDELRDKFGVTGHRLGDSAELPASGVIVGSLDTAKGRLREQLVSTRWDVLVVDECHVLKNHRTDRFRLVFDLPRDRTLLLSATPVQNELRELYNLVTLCRPGHFKSYRQFRRLFVQDKTTARNVESLKKMLDEVMIRNRRSEVLPSLPPRHVHHHHLKAGAEERALAAEVLELCRTAYARSGWRPPSSDNGDDLEQVAPPLVLALLVLLKESTSSPRALASTLGGPILDRIREVAPEYAAGARDLVARARAIGEPTKMRALREIVRAAGDHQVIVFTEFLETLQHLHETLAADQVPTLVFHGGLSGSQKRRVVQAFRGGEARVLLSTESGAQGLNLQTAHNLVNFDLPWNPTRLEQRIGRVHRIGQRQPVHVHTLTLSGTIEEYVLDVLTEKIDLFEAVIGEVDTVLSFMDRQRSFELRIAETLLETRDYSEVEAAFGRLGAELARANEAFLAAQRETTAVLEGLDA